MEENNWYRIVKKDIGSLKDKMSKGDYKDYRLDLLLRIAKRLEISSLQCEKCSIFKEGITNILAYISDWPDTTKEQKQNYKLVFRSITEHLIRQHHVTKKRWPLWIPTLIGGVLGALPSTIGTLILYSTEPSQFEVDISIPMGYMSAIAGFIIGTILGLIIGLIINKIRRKTINVPK